MCIDSDLDIEEYSNISFAVYQDTVSQYQFLQC